MEARKLEEDMSVIISALSVLRWDFSLTRELAVLDGLVGQGTPAYASPTSSGVT